VATHWFCLGDGHQGLNLVSEFGTAQQRWEILDWYHLKENLYKVVAQSRDLERLKLFLWRGDVEAAKTLLPLCQVKSKQFCAYLDQHCHRIQLRILSSWQICSIGSGAVESAIKVLGTRIKISGAQWNSENVNQILSVRCAYLNGLLALS